MTNPNCDICKGSGMYIGVKFCPCTKPAKSDPDWQAVATQAIVLLRDESQNTKHSYDPVEDEHGVPHWTKHREDCWRCRRDALLAQPDIAALGGKGNE